MFSPNQSTFLHFYIQFVRCVKIRLDFYYVMNMCCHISFFQLQSRFEQLKRLHAEEKAALEEKKRLLDDDQSSFGKRKAAAQLLQAQSLTANGKKDKDRKK